MTPNPEPTLTAEELDRLERNNYQRLIDGVEVIPLVRMARRALSAVKRVGELEEERDAYHDTLCHLTTELLPGRGCWSTEELMGAIKILKSQLATLRAEREKLLLESADMVQFRKLESEVLSLRAERDGIVEKCVAAAKKSIEHNYGYSGQVVATDIIRAIPANQESRTA